MKASEIEPGMILKGHYGQIREVVWVRGIKCGYRQLGNGSVTGKGMIEIGTLSDPVMKLTLAEWAESEITEDMRFLGRKGTQETRKVVERTPAKVCTASEEKRSHLGGAA